MTTKANIALDSATVYDLRAPNDNNRIGTLTITGNAVVVEVGRMAATIDGSAPDLNERVKAAAADMLDAQAVLR